VIPGYCEINSEADKVGYRASTFGIHSEYATLGNKEIICPNRKLERYWAYDLGIIIMDGHFNNGSYNVISLDHTELNKHKIHVTGYPGPAPLATEKFRLKRMEGGITEVINYPRDNPTAGILCYDHIYTSGGQSGGGASLAMPHEDHGLGCIGIHTGSAKGGGRGLGTRITPEKLSLIQGWANLLSGIA
jgi:V8-like Glu-specific endopeptidase